MAAYIDKIYGAGTATMLQMKARVKTRLDRNILKIRIKYYKDRIKE